MCNLGSVCDLGSSDRGYQAVGERGVKSLLTASVNRNPTVVCELCVDRESVLK